VVYVLLMSCFTVLAIPYLAWGAEIAEDYHERTAVVQIRSLFGVLGGVVGATAPVAIASQFSDQRVGFGAMGGILGSILIVAALVTGVGVQERSRGPAVSASWTHFRGGLRRTFRNRDFRIVFVTFCLMTLSGAVGQSMQLFVVKYWLGMYEFFPIIALVFALSLAVSFPLWMLLARRLGKRRALLIGLGMGCVTPLGWLLVAPGDRVAMLLFMLVAGTVTGSLTLAMSSAIDVVDFDEWETGERREGAYFGIWTLGLKSMGALGALLGGALLAWVEIDSRSVPSNEALGWLLLTVGPLQAVSHLVGFLVMRRFGFDATDVATVQAALAERRAALRGSI
jgi:GPH family glycoside/pentoside/hexuronide:cation symporter